MQSMLSRQGDRARSAGACQPGRLHRDHFMETTNSVGEASATCRGSPEGRFHRDSVSPKRTTSPVEGRGFTSRDHSMEGRFWKSNAKQKTNPQALQGR